MVLSPSTTGELGALRSDLVSRHATIHGETKDLLVGLQLTHSGRFARPNDKARLEPRIAYRHPILDARFGIASDDALLSDDDLDSLVGDFVQAAVLAQ